MLKGQSRELNTLPRRAVNLADTSLRAAKLHTGVRLARPTTLVCYAPDASMHQITKDIKCLSVFPQATLAAATDWLTWLQLLVGL